MRNLLACLALCTVALAPSTVRAGVVNLDITFELVLATGADTLGLSGATVNFQTSFADGTTYADDGFLNPFATTSSHSLAISSAMNPLSNGTFSDPDGPLNYNPSGFGAFFLDSTLFFPRTQVIDAGLSFVFGIDLAGPGVVPSIGDYVNASDFASTPSGFSDLSVVVNDGVPAHATYAIATSGTTPFTVTATGSTDPNSGGGGPGVVPEPSSLSVFAMGTLLMGCGFRRRRR